MFTVNIEKETIDNEDYRRVLATEDRQQLVVMSIPANEDIGTETHPSTDQFIRIEQGNGLAVIDGKEISLEDGTSLVISAGSEHNISNTGDSPLKLYSIYSPPEHPDGLVQKDKEVKKAIPQVPQQQALPQQNQMMVPQFDPYDMSIQQSVQSQLGSIGNMGDKELVKLSSAVWGDGYEYKPVSANQIRAELRGYLQDQLEWLKIVNPLMAQTDPSFMPDQMPHSSDSLQDLSSGTDKSGDLLNEPTLDGKISQQEMSQSSSTPESFPQKKKDTL